MVLPNNNVRLSANDSFKADRDGASSRNSNRLSSKSVKISINEASRTDQDDNRRSSRRSNASRVKKDEPSTPDNVPLTVFISDSTTWADADNKSEASFGTTPLHEAATEGDNNTVKSLLMNPKTDVNAVNGDGWTSLHLAVKGGHLNTVRSLLADHRTNINIGGGFIGCTPLHLSAKGGHHEILKLFLQDSKINVNAMDKNGSTALHILTKESCKRYGIDKRFMRCIKSLMERSDLKMNKPDMYGHTAISHAVRNGNKETVRTILQYHGKHRLNLDTSAADEMKTVREAILSLFPEFRPIVPPPLMENIDSSSTQTRLLSAIQHDCLDMFRDVLKNNSVNLEHWYDEPYYCTCLELACTLEGRHKFAQILVESGANVNTVNPVSDVPLLHMTAKRGNLDQLNLLLSTDRIDLNIKDCCQRTVLHCLARLSVTRQEEVQGLQQSLALILEGDCCSSRTIDLDATDEWGNTALHVASRSRNSEMVEILLRNGADINKTDGCGESALHIACRDGNQDTVVVLLKQGADLMFNKFRHPPLAQIDRSTLRRFFDECLDTNDKTPQHQDFRLTFNYSFLSPKTSNLKDKRHNAEMPMLLYMSQDRRLRHMLKHPIITSFLHLKWNQARCFFYVNLFTYVIFLCLLTTHVLITDYSKTKPCNETNHAVNGERFGNCNISNHIFPNKTINESTIHSKNTDKEVTGESSIVNITPTETLVSEITPNTNKSDTLVDVTLQPSEKSKESLTENYEKSSHLSNGDTLDENPSQFLVRICLIVFVSLFTFRELMHFLSATTHYLRRPSTLLRFGVIILTYVICLNFFDAETKHHCSSVVILLAWFEFLVRIGCVPGLSILMQMLQTVSWTFIKFMSFYSPLIIAFSLCVYTMLRKSCEGLFFENFGMTMLKSVLMLNGEYEASDMEFDLLPITSHIILVLFILLVGVILLNLLSGLAVSDTQAIKNDAETLSLIARVRHISNIEYLVAGAAESKWILPRLITIVAPNLCLVFKRFPEKQIHVFPNRTKGTIVLDESGPRMNTAMNRDIVTSALKQISKKNSCTGSSGNIQETVVRAWGSENGVLVSKRVKDLCEQQEILTNQVKELKDLYECKLTRVEEELRNSLENMVREVAVKYDLLNASQEKIGKELVERKADMREVLCKSQSGLQGELLKQSEQVIQLERKFCSLEETVTHTRQTVDQIYSLLLSQQGKA